MVGVIFLNNGRKVVGWVLWKMKFGGVFVVF